MCIRDRCTRCASVFEWNERKNNRCPECKGIYTVIRFANPSDEEYLDRVSMRFSAVSYTHLVNNYEL